jgi:hypothetical protein
MREPFALAAAAMIALTGQAPAPVPSSLPVIGHTHAKGFCATVRDNVAPSVLGLMKTDDLIGAGHRALLKSAHDASTGSTDELQMDRLYLEKVVGAMAHNLGIVKKMLSDTNRFPKTPVTDDDKLAALLRAQLQAAADRQNDALNHIDGILETEGMSSMRHDISSAMQTTTANAGGQTPAGAPGGFLDSSTVPGANPLPLGGTAAVAPSRALGHTIWDRLAADVEIQQAHIAAAEQTLTPTVVAVATAVAILRQAQDRLRISRRRRRSYSLDQ